MFLDISSRPSNIECISQYLSICKSVLVTHPSQPKHNIAFFLQKSNNVTYKLQNYTFGQFFLSPKFNRLVKFKLIVISSKTESMVDSAQIHTISPPWAIPHCGLIIWFPSLFDFPDSCPEWISDRLDYYWLFWK